MCWKSEAKTRQRSQVGIFLFEASLRPFSFAILSNF
jgi:hypothetical protein